MILSICTPGSVCLFPGNKRGGIWTNVYYSEYSLCVRCCVRPWPKGRQTDLAFSPVFEEFVAWIAVQDLETLTSKRSTWETLALEDYPKVTALRAPVTHLLSLWKKIPCKVIGDSGFFKREEGSLVLAMVVGWYIFPQDGVVVEPLLILLTFHS